MAELAVGGDVGMNAEIDGDLAACSARASMAGLGGEQAESAAAVAARAALADGVDPVAMVARRVDGDLAIVVDRDRAGIPAVMPVMAPRIDKHRMAAAIAAFTAIGRDRDAVGVRGRQPAIIARIRFPVRQGQACMDRFAGIVGRSGQVLRQLVAGIAGAVDGEVVVAHHDDVITIRENGLVVAVGDDILVLAVDLDRDNVAE